jgi:4-amino-4-deoxy-L-arabinose transferase-like glycosyltransferase
MRPVPRAFADDRSSSQENVLLGSLESLAAPPASARCWLAFSNSLWPVVACTALATLLRLLYLGRNSLWLDEGVSYVIATSPDRPHDSIWAYQALYHELLRAWIHLGDSEFALRLFSVIPSVATIPVVWWLGRRLHSARAGWLATLLMSLHVAHIAYSQQARGYGLVVFFCCLAACFLVRAVEGDAPTDWLLYAVFSLLAVYSHLLAFLVVPAELFSLAALPAAQIRWRRLVPSAGLIVAGVLPVLWLLRQTGVSSTEFIVAATYLRLPAWVALLAGDPVALPLYLIFWVAAGWLAWRTWKAQRRSLAAWRLTLPLSWSVVPAILLLFFSLAKPAFVPRYLLVSAPAAVLWAAVGAAELRPRPRRLLVAVTVALCLVALIHDYRRPHEDWRDASSYVFAHAQPGDTVLVLPPYARLPFLYYEHRLGTYMPIENTDSPRPGAAWLDHMTHYRRCWVMVYRDPADPVARAYISLLAHRFSLADSQRFPRVSVQLYASSQTGGTGASASATPGQAGRTPRAALAAVFAAGQR